jgi:aminopeptidase N
MSPGDTLTFTSRFEYQTPKLLAQQNHSFIGNSFTYLRSVPLIPTVGYQVNYQLTDKNLRLRHNLNNAITLPSKALSANRTSEGKYDWLTVNSTVSVDLGQTALSQGKLERSWQENDRLYFKFSEHVPMRAIPSWLSVPSALVSEQSNNTKVNIFTKHNNDATSTIMRATEDTLNWLSKHVASYRYEQLNIVNAPDQISGYALPQIILLGDRNNFRAIPKPDSGFDQRYRRAAHETAHQWFGHDIGNGIDADRAFLIESLAKYIELVVIEGYQGKQQMEALVEYEKARFNRAQRHSMTSETGLIDANTSHEQYSKATIVFAELRQLIGDDVIISALKQLWVNYAYPNEPAHSMDFLHYLLQSIPKQHLFRVKALLTEPLN